MNFAKYLTAFSVFSVIAGSAMPAFAITIDFESLEQNNSQINSQGISYSEDGFTISTDSPDGFELSTFGTQESRYPGSTALFDNNVDGTLTLTQDNGNPYNLNSISLTSLNSDTSVGVNFTGIKANSSIVTQSFTTNNDLDTLETFNFSNDFTNLQEVSWIQESPFHQFDNIVVNQTSEPTQPVPFEAEGTMGLVALGGYFFYRHRKKRKQALAQDSNS